MSKLIAEPLAFGLWFSGSWFHSRSSNFMKQFIITKRTDAYKTECDVNNNVKLFYPVVVAWG